MRSFPHTKQLDSMDCGPACLKTVLKYYKIDVPLSYLREKCYKSRIGVSLLDISSAAEAVGLNAVRVKISWDQLCNEVIYPCIIYWNSNHFVVVYKIRKRRGKTIVYISDPAIGLVECTKEQFCEAWFINNSCLGIALLLEPRTDFTPTTSDTKTKKYGLNVILAYLKPHAHSIVQLLLSMLIASVLNLIIPFTTQSIVDQGISLGKMGIIKMMLCAQLMITLGQVANEVIRNWLMLHMTARVGISLISDFLSKLMRLPIAFFDKKRAGDILQRIQDHGRVQAFLTSSLLSIVMAVLLLIIYGGILGGYSLKILAIFVIGSGLYIGWILLFLRLRRKIDYLRFNESANQQSSIIQLVGGMQDIKLNNCEKQKLWEWERIQAKLFKIGIKTLSLSQSQQVGGSLIDQVKNIIISFLAAKSVINGNMTLGMMTALQYILGQLNAPISQFISFIRSSQDASISMERLGEIHKLEDEEPNDLNRRREVDSTSDIIFHDVVYQYGGPNSPVVLDNISLQIPHGKTTAIVGASGSGKTTLMKMMLGFYRPISGTITLGGIELQNYSQTCWRKQCGCVMQDGYIFSNTIAENIGLCDETPNMERVRDAAKIANIQEWIEDLPQSYNTMIGVNGQGLSIGQRQRILIARAAYKNTPFLFFDEATNSLDANNEKGIMDNLNSLFINKTVVIIAHRLSTVKNADNIIVLDQGKIVEEGTHAQLVEMRGYYYELVKNQLDLGKE